MKIMYGKWWMVVRLGGCVFGFGLPRYRHVAQRAADELTGVGYDQ